MFPPDVPLYRFPILGSDCVEGKNQDIEVQKYKHDGKGNPGEQGPYALETQEDRSKNRGSDGRYGEHVSGDGGQRGEDCLDLRRSWGGFLLDVQNNMLSHRNIGKISRIGHLVCFCVGSGQEPETYIGGGSVVSVSLFSPKEKVANRSIGSVLRDFERDRREAQACECEEGLVCFLRSFSVASPSRPIQQQSLTIH